MRIYKWHVKYPCHIAAIKQTCSKRNTIITLRITQNYRWIWTIKRIRINTKMNDSILILRNWIRRVNISQKRWWCFKCINWMVIFCYCSTSRIRKTADIKDVFTWASCIKTDPNEGPLHSVKRHLLTSISLMSRKHAPPLT